jgi:HTH-type transcriptional regulator/antitoxin HipB
MTVQELGKTIRAARVQLRLTQEELAAAAGVGERFLSEIERGKATARFDTILRVLDALGLTISVTPRQRPTSSQP